MIKNEILCIRWRGRVRLFPLPPFTLWRGKQELRIRLANCVMARAKCKPATGIMIILLGWIGATCDHKASDIGSKVRSSNELWHAN